VRWRPAALAVRTQRVAFPRGACSRCLRGRRLLRAGCGYAAATLRKLADCRRHGRAAGHSSLVLCCASATLRCCCHAGALQHSRRRTPARRSCAVGPFACGGNARRRLGRAELDAAESSRILIRFSVPNTGRKRASSTRSARSPLFWAPGSAAPARRCCVPAAGRMCEPFTLPLPWHSVFKLAPPAGASPHQAALPAPLPPAGPPRAAALAAAPEAPRAWTPAEYAWDPHTLVRAGQRRRSTGAKPHRRAFSHALRRRARAAGRARHAARGRRAVGGERPGGAGAAAGVARATRQRAGPSCRGALCAHALACVPATACPRLALTRSPRAGGRPRRSCAKCPGAMRSWRPLAMAAPQGRAQRRTPSATACATCTCAGACCAAAARVARAQRASVRSLSC
jgi:hypothetical protein